ncbi:MAG: DUF975 family protein [Bacteroidaceae bacterium]|nr:DUF975 family protein [Bacteroidaceae bacterium]
MDNYNRIKDAAYFREQGWSQLSNRWTPAVGVTFLFSLIGMLVNSAFGTVNLSLVGTFLVLPIYYSYYVAFLNNKRTGAAIDTDALFVGYNDFQRISLTLALLYVYTFLWTLLFIIPGIIKSISYSQTVYVLKDCPELSYNQAIERSMAMMDGHKWQYFCLMLSFIGWILLVCLTMGIATLWVTPYMTATMAHFYEYVKEEYEKRTAI